MFKRLFNKPKAAATEIPKYRLVPDSYGTYTLEHWHPRINMYLALRSGMTYTRAMVAIDNVEQRKNIYVPAIAKRDETAS